MNPYEKGDKLENQAAGLLSYWVATHKEVPISTAIFSKASDSGSTATVLMRNTPISKQNGFAIADIFPVHPAGFEITEVAAFECKHYAAFAWNRVLFTPYKLSSTNHVWSHWSHLKGLADTYNVTPFLVYRDSSIRSCPPLLLSPHSWGVHLRSLLGDSKLPLKSYRATLAHPHLDVYDMEVLLDEVPVDLFITTCKLYLGDK